jgi:hypothetical protein
MESYYKLDDYVNVDVINKKFSKGDWQESKIFNAKDKMKN